MTMTTNTAITTATTPTEVESETKAKSETKIRIKIKQPQGVTPEDFQLLLIATADLPFLHQTRAKTDYMEDVMETTLNLHIQEPVVINALNYFKRHHNPPPSHQSQSSVISTHWQLVNVLNGFADTKEGNKAAAQFLWGNFHWTRVELLRKFLVFLSSINVTDQPSLHAWAKQADFERDFQGKVRGLGIAVFHWLLIRCGVPSVKPDIWVISFAQRVLGKRVSEKKLVQAFTEIAPLIGESMQTIDLTLWYFEKLAMATTDAPQLRIVWWHILKAKLEALFQQDPGRVNWQVVLGDKEKLRYSDAGISIKNCSVLATVDPSLAAVTVDLHQSQWDKGFELELRIAGDAPLPQATFDQLKAKLVPLHKREWELSNVPALSVKLHEQFDSKFVATTTLVQLTEWAAAIAHCFVEELAELQALCQPDSVLIPVEYAPEEEAAR